MVYDWETLEQVPNPWAMDWCQAVAHWELGCASSGRACVHEDAFAQVVHAQTVHLPLPVPPVHGAGKVVDCCTRTIIEF